MDDEMLTFENVNLQAVEAEYLRILSLFQFKIGKLEWIKHRNCIKSTESLNRPIKGIIWKHDEPNYGCGLLLSLCFF